jgi:hypothetical protein
MAPESYYLDYALVQRPRNADAQIDLLGDYQNNISLWPKFRDYFCTS